jgi:hypothetical protein
MERTGTFQRNVPVHHEQRLQFVTPPRVSEPAGVSALQEATLLRRRKPASVFT